MERKTSEKMEAWEHSSCELMQGGRGGEGPIFKYVHIETWKRVFYRSRRVVSFTLMFGVQTVVEHLNGLSSALFWWLGPSPLCPPHLHLLSTSCPPLVHLTSFTWWILPGLPHFSQVFLSHVLLWRQMKVKAGEAREQGYIWQCLINNIFNSLPGVGVGL